MRLVGFFALACGCNQYFGVDSTKLIDAPPAVQVDAQVPPSCPALGTVPTFKNELYQMPARYCYGYSASDATNTGVALCNSAVYAGAVEATMSPIPMSPLPTTPGFVRIAPEGDRLYVGVYQQVAPYGTALHEFAFDAAGATDRGSVFSYTDGGYFTASTPTRGPERSSVFSLYDTATSATALVEIVDTGAGWHELRRTPLADLGVTSLEEPSLSPDGLRLVFTSYGSGIIGGGGGGWETTSTPSNGAELPPEMVGQPDQPLYYTDRPSRDQPFGPAQPLVTVPSFVQWPYLTEDCGRIYFSALNTLFYLRQ